MKFTKLMLPLLLCGMFMFNSSCTTRLVEFTVISTKNAEIGANKVKGKRTEGKKTYFLGIGFNLKDAIDAALENAGNDYDLLVDGVVTYTNLPFVVKVTVKGKAIRSAEMVGELGQKGFEDWCKIHNVLDPNTVVATPEP